MRVLFVDDRPIEIRSLWERAGLDSGTLEVLPLVPFESVEQVLELVADCHPDVIVVGHGLGKYPITGSDVVRALQETCYHGCIIGNSGGGAIAFERDGVLLDGNVDRNPKQLQQLLNMIVRVCK